MISVGIVGGTGYTGVELLRLLAQHEQVEVTVITSRAEQGRRLDDRTGVVPDLELPSTNIEAVLDDREFEPVAAVAEHAPEVDQATRAAVGTGRTDLCFFRLDPEAYAQAPDISIDYAVMEHVQGMVVPVECGWNDLGSWKTVWQESPRDGSQVAVSANATAIDCKRTLLRSTTAPSRVARLNRRARKKLRSERR